MIFGMKASVCITYCNPITGSRSMPLRLSAEKRVIPTVPLEMS
jgi:hypothetical protein